MIENISSWAEQIIVVVIIATLIEMILPNGNNKKYVKAVIGVYILFTIISPIFKKGTTLDFDKRDYEKYFKQDETYTTMSESLITHNNQSVEDIYIMNLKEDMKQKLQEKGYQAEKIEVQVELQEEKNYGRVKEINLTISKMKEENKKETSNISIAQVNTIQIGNTIQTKDTRTRRKWRNSFF